MCLCVCLINVPVNSNVGTSPPFYGTSLPKLRCHDVAKVLQFIRLKQVIHVCEDGLTWPLFLRILMPSKLLASYQVVSLLVQLCVEAHEALTDPDENG